MSNRFFDPKYLKGDQYNNADKLAARIRLHRDYTVPTIDIWDWFFTIALAEAPEEARLLEVGTGRGDVWQRNAARVPAGWQMTLTDFSAGMIADNQKHLGELAQRMSYDVLDVQNIPFADDSFDVIFANYMLYHVPDLAKGVAELRRVLKPGGVLFAMTNGANHMRELYEFSAIVDPSIDPAAIFSLRTFSSQNGTATLGAAFSDVRYTPFESALVVDAAQPILDYVASMMTIPGETFVGEKEAALRARLEERIAAEGHIRIEKESGLFIAR
ncbi:MAG: methyltransferase domain-containing protein [Anaerolineae bacterium]|nr:methyltransferase domain-containing protein [Anaerolineae bacterium]